MKSIGSPILGDTLYGGDEAEHLFLHAWRLVFDYRGEHFDIWVAPDKTWPSEIDLDTGKYLRLDSAKHQTDGFFAAVLQRKE